MDGCMDLLLAVSRSARCRKIDGGIEPRQINSAPGRDSAKAQLWLSRTPILSGATMRFASCSAPSPGYTSLYPLEALLRALLARPAYRPSPPRLTRALLLI